MDNGQQTSPVFLTVNNESGEKNPWSVLIIETLQNSNDCRALVVCTVDLAGQMNEEQKTKGAEGREIIPVFDQRFGINQWSPCLGGMCALPDWVHILSPDRCVAIGREGVKSESTIAGVTTQIMRVFLGGPPKNGSNWVEVLKQGAKPRRSWRSNQNAWPPAHWRR